MPLNLDRPREDERDLYRQLIQVNSRNLETEQLDRLIELFFNPGLALTTMGIAREVGVTKPTALRYKKLLLAAQERGPAIVLQSVVGPGGQIKNPSLGVDLENQMLAHRENAQTRDMLRRNRTRLSAQETSEGIDAKLRLMFKDPDAKATDIKALVDQKMKLEDLSNPGQEVVIDPRKVLGEQGLAGMLERWVKRFALIATHRHELPQLWAGATAHIIITVLEDVERGKRLPEGINADTFKYIAELAAANEAKEKKDDEEEVPRETSEEVEGAQFDAAQVKPTVVTDETSTIVVEEE